MVPVDNADAPIQAESAETQVHLRDYVRVLLARRWVLISTFLIVVLGALTAVLIQTPVYKARALLLIEPKKVNITEFKAVYDPTLGGSGGALGNREFYETQYRLIVCRPILERTFKQFDFGSMEEFRNLKNPIEVFAELFAVTPVRRSRLVAVDFEWRDPELAARAADYLIKEYISDYRQRTVGVTEGGLSALRQKAEELRPEVEAKSNELMMFMTEKNMVSLDREQNIALERLKEINKNLSDVEKDRAQYESVFADIAQALEEERSLDDMPEVAGSDAIRDLKLEYIKAKQESKDLSSGFGPRHPEVVAVTARLKTIADKIQEEVQGLLATAQAELSRSNRLAKQLREELDQQEQRVLELNALSAQYRMLEKAHATLSNTYQAIVQRVEEIEISMAAGSSDDNIFIISHPKVPVKPSKPRKKLALLLACFVGLMLGGGVCFFVDYLDTTIKTKDDAEKALGAPVIGYVPALREGDLAQTPDGDKRAIELLALDKPRSAVAECFRSIRTALAFSSVDEDHTNLVVTSSSPKEGKTLASVNLSLALAQAGKKVLLVDADMRKPRLHKVFRVSSSPGLSNILAGEGVSRFQDALRSVAGIDNLGFIPSGPLPPNPAELLGSGRMKDLLRDVHDHFDVVVFDTPPAINVTDSAVLSRSVHGAIMVVRCFSTQRELARRSRDLLSQAGGKLLGVILNNVDVPRGGYYAYDSYYYYHQDYYYYGDDNSKSIRKRRRRRASSRRT